MGQKKKVGKSRQDKFYKLAKESGYRARSAFKLIQLNRKFEFLQSSKVVIDLCAAPGGWLQVASQNTPVSSVIIGVDLMPIKPIPRVTTLIGDITSDKCRKDLKKELQTWKADCVLNDGAPNVGQNWVHDAFQQNQLTLQAVRLATEFLRKGGWFVTKVFRSKDYNALLWVLHQLFKNVHATKPQASRNESAEIFVVCQNFIAPDRIDPKFLDPKSVFKEVEIEPQMSINLMHPEKQVRHRDGYPTGDYTLYHTLNVTDFLTKPNYLELLSNANAVVFDDKSIEKHPLTTDEIKECFKDIKVLGKIDIKKLINWRKKIKAQLDKAGKAGEDDEKADKEEGSEDELEKLEAQLAELKGEERKALKRKIKKTRKEKSKLRRKMDMKMVIAGDQIDLNDDCNLFDLNKIKRNDQLKSVEMVKDAYEDDSEGDSDLEAPQKKKTESYDRHSKGHLLDGGDSDDMSDAEGDDDDDDNDEDGADSDASDNNDMEWESGDEMDDQDSDDENEDMGGSNPLVVGKLSKNIKTDMWFSKESFAGLENEMDEDIEMEKMVEVYQKKGGVVTGVSNKTAETPSKSKKVKADDNTGKVETTSDEKHQSKSKVSEKNEKKLTENKLTEKVDDSDSDSDSYSESEEDEGGDEDAIEFYKQQKQALKKNKQAGETAQDDFEVVPDIEPVKLSAKALAVGAAIVSSRKRRRDVIESGYNRYMMFGEEDLPDWFARDEILHQRVQMPVTKGEIQEYKLKMKAIDANPIKKVAEAKARKKRKMMKKLDRARKKADAINETLEVSDKEKWQQIKQVYKKAGLLSAKKKDVKYVVSKKSQAGKRPVRPSGVKGPYRVVDGRMKKDKRAQARAGKSRAGGKQNNRGKQKK